MYSQQSILPPRSLQLNPQQLPLQPFLMKPPPLDVLVHTSSVPSSTTIPGNPMSSPSKRELSSASSQNFAQAGGTVELKKPTLVDGSHVPSSPKSRTPKTQ